MNKIYLLSCWFADNSEDQWFFSGRPSAQQVKGCLFKSRVESSDDIINDLMYTGFTDRTVYSEVALREIELMGGEHDLSGPMPCL